MTHARTTLRQAVAAALEGASIVATGNVFANRALSAWPEEMPCLNVGTGSEESKPARIPGTAYDRTLPVLVDLIVQPSDASVVDDLLDDLADQVERAVDAAGTLGDVVAGSLTLVSTGEPEFETAGDRLLGRIRLTFIARYFY
jgi:hypothetical protein